MRRSTRQPQSDGAIVASTEPSYGRNTLLTARTNSATQPRITRSQSRQLSSEPESQPTRTPRSARNASRRATGLAPITEQTPSEERLGNAIEQADSASEDYQDADDGQAHDDDDEYNELSEDEDNLPADPRDIVPADSQAGTPMPPENHRLNVQVLELDPPTFIADLEDLWNNAEKLLDLLLPENEEQRLAYLEQVAQADTREARIFKSYRTAFDLFREIYGKVWGYIEPVAVLQCLFGTNSSRCETSGPWRPDAVVQSVNMAQMLIDLFIDNDEGEWEAVTTVERLFPRMIAGEEYNHDAFEIALELTTQSTLARIAAGETQLENDPDSISRFFLTADEDGDQLYKHWITLGVNEQDRIKQTKCLRDVRRRLSELSLPDEGQPFRPARLLNSWRESFLWSEFKEQVLSYCFDQRKRLKMTVDYAGGIAGIKDAIQLALRTGEQAEQHIHNRRSTGQRQSLMSLDRGFDEPSTKYDRKGTSALKHLLKDSIQAPESSSKKRQRIESPLFVPEGPRENSYNPSYDIEDDGQPESSSHTRKRQKTVAHDADDDDNDDEESIEPTQDHGFETAPVDMIAAAARRETVKQRRNTGRVIHEDSDHDEPVGDNINVTSTPRAAPLASQGASSSRTRDADLPPVRVKIQAQDENFGRRKTTKARSDPDVAQPQREQIRDEPLGNDDNDVDDDGDDDQDYRPAQGSVSTQIPIAERIQKTKRLLQAEGLIIAQKRKPWTIDEEAALYELVPQIPITNGTLSYSGIKGEDAASGAHRLAGRTPENIRDKARNMCKAMVIQLGTNENLPPGWDHVKLMANMISDIRKKGATWVVTPQNS